MLREVQHDIKPSRIFAVSKATLLDLDEPEIPRKRKIPARQKQGNATEFFPDKPEEHYMRLYLKNI